MEVTLSEREVRIQQANRDLEEAQQDVARLKEQLQDGGPFRLGPIHVTVGANGQIVNPLENLNEAEDRLDECFFALERALDIPYDSPSENLLLNP